MFSRYDVINYNKNGQFKSEPYEDKEYEDNLWFTEYNTDYFIDDSDVHVFDTEMMANNDYQGGGGEEEEGEEEEEEGEEGGIERNPDQYSIKLFSRLKQNINLSQIDDVSTEKMTAALINAKFPIQQQGGSSNKKRLVGSPLRYHTKI